MKKLIENNIFTTSTVNDIDPGFTEKVTDI